MAEKPVVISIPDPRSIELIFSPENEKRLRSSYTLIEGTSANAVEILDKHIEQADFIMGQPDLSTEILKRAKKLRAIFNVESNFMDNMDYDYCFAHGIHVLSTGKVFAVPVAEIGLGLALALERNIAGADRDFRRNAEKWGGDGNTEARLLTGGKVGIIGFGDLGKALHRVLQGFRPTISVYDPWLPPGLLSEFGVTPASLDEVLSGSDVIFVVASVTSDNGGFLGAKEFAKMKKGTSFVLLSRAGVVDFDALADAVKRGHIKAASDVYPEEPLPANHPIRSLENFVHSAHRAGALDIAFKKMGEMVLDDMELVARGLPPVVCRRAERETVRRMRSKPVTRN